MRYRHVIDSCRAETIGDAGLDDVELEARLAGCAAGLTTLRRQQVDGSLPLLRLPARRDDLGELQTIAADWRRRFGRVVLLGTGGSSLGARALAALAPPGGPELIVLDNLDPDGFGAFASGQPLDRTGLLIVSKSGGTAETLSQALVCLPALQAAIGQAALSRQVLAVVEPGNSALRQLAAAYRLPVLAHDPGVGGRFSVLSLVGLLPALLLGLDAAKVRDGAAEVLDQALAATRPAEVPAAVGAALAVALAERRGIAEAVLLPYVGRLETFALWYCQLWAESLGKAGHGITPVRALGPVDQHSQLQLYLDGPANKLFTLITLPMRGSGPLVPEAEARRLGLDYLAGRRIGDLVAAMQRATAETLAKRGRPVRRIELERLDEATLGALLMHFMLETILAAHLLKIDPYDQPAVEEGKVLARCYLAQMAAVG
ncbi:MAG: glucose-6-phosphate isomerase [Alphaproteobacteria bacterium]|nr:glucose-6-phosphate isomerase [Alphaproteobacteria bacterium]